MAGDVRGRGVHGKGAYMAGGHVWQGACVAGAYMPHMPPDRMTDACLRAAIKTFAHFEFIL